MKSNTILLVEDNADDEELTLRALGRIPLATDVAVVRDGEEALDYLFGRGHFATRELPVLVLLDLKLPKVDGIEVLAQVNAEPALRHIPIVVLTTSAEESDIAASYVNGANSYVRKPVNFGEFAEAVAQLGQYWLMLNRMARS